MDSFAIEVSAYRIGGSDYFERVFVPRILQLWPGGETVVQLQGRIRPSAIISVHLTDWTIVRPGILSCLTRVAGENGRPLAPERPALYSEYPCDVPLYSSHIGYDADDGVVTIGLRRPSRSWMPEHTALLAQAG